ncbi:MAG: Dabb family protein [Verrucomicrobiae bacterium]|nr:Dabb family protein [Verrucomicrobiae bacterium]
MIHHIVFFKLKPEVDGPKLDEMIRSTRSQLLEVPGVIGVQSGQNIDTEAEWPFFLNVEVATLEDLRQYSKDPIHVNYVETVIKPNTTERLALDFQG